MTPRAALAALLLALAAAQATADDAPPAVQATADDPPPAVQALVPAGWSLRAWAQADLDGDGRADAVLVIEPDPEAQPEPDGNEARPLWVALAGRDGELSVVARNDRLVRCRQCGGTWPDPLDHLRAWRGGFALGHYGGTRWRWSDEWRFVHDAQARTWFLSRWQDGFDAADHSGHRLRSYRRGQHFGSVRFDRLDPDHFRQRQLWRHVRPPPARPAPPS